MPINPGQVSRISPVRVLARMILPVLLGGMLLAEPGQGAAGVSGIKPGRILGLDNPQRVFGRYILSFRGNPDERRLRLLESRYGVRILFRAGGRRPAMVVQAEEEQVRSLLTEEDIAFAGADGWMELYTVQADPPSRGLDRIDSRRGADGLYEYHASGRGVHVYVADTGILADHPEFKGRVASGFSLAEAKGGGDCHGHGTHVASVIGGRTVGVAREVTLHPVRVFTDCKALQSDVIRGLVWIRDNAEKPAIVNISLGGPREENGAVAEFVRTLTEEGIHVVAAAGNQHDDACDYTPAFMPEVITVGTADDDQRPAFDRTWGSNTGPCVDLYAPGVGIAGAALPDTGKVLINRTGTSVSAPFVAGAAALILQHEPDLTPAELRRRLVEGATRGEGEAVPLLYTNPPEQAARRLHHELAIPQIVTEPDLGFGLGVELAGIYPGESAGALLERSDSLRLVLWDSRAVALRPFAELDPFDDSLLALALPR